MKKLSKIIKLLLVGLVILSCRQDEFFYENLHTSEESVSHSVLSNAQLQEVAEIMVSFINEQEVKDEIYTYASKGTDFEVYKEFNSLFTTSESGDRKLRSLLATKLHESINKCTNCRANSKDSIIAVLKEHYAIYAPYLAENFQNSELPLTISWWDGIDDSGITPGISSLDFLSGRVESLIEVNDEYASSNPTVLIVPIEDGDDQFLCPNGDPCDNGGGSTSGSGSNGDSGSTNPPRDIDCRELEEDVVLELRMPKFRLNGNTRGWPSKNMLYLWTVAGEFTIGSNGFIQASPRVNKVWNGHPVSRNNAAKGNWLNSEVAFIWNSWKQSQVDLRIIVAHKKRKSEVEITQVVKIDTDGNYSAETTTEYSISKEKAKEMFNVAFDRCSTLATMTSDGGFGTKNGFRVWQWGKFSFYLEPVLR
jgi:hypothetical protein